jgi:hypothetical protein
MNTRLHLARARRAWPILVRAAARRTPLTYGELTAKLGLHWRAAGWFLGVIQRHCAAAGKPRLQAFAVNKQTRRPGKGYAGKRGARAHERELDRVRAHRWSKKAPF